MPGSKQNQAIHSVYTEDRQGGNAARAEPHNGSKAESREKAGPPNCKPMPEREA